jgi:hypothetical protein
LLREVQRSSSEEIDDEEKLLRGGVPDGGRELTG